MSKSKYHSQSYTTVREPELKTSNEGNPFTRVLAKSKDGKLRELIYWAKKVEDVGIVEKFFEATEAIGSCVLVSGSISDDGAVFVNYFETEKSYKEKETNTQGFNTVTKIEYIEEADSIKVLEYYPNRIVSYYEAKDKFILDLWGKLKRLDEEVCETLGGSRAKSLYLECSKSVNGSKVRGALTAEVLRRFNKIKSALQEATE